MSDTVLFERLDELVDDCGGARGDWDDVRRRAHVAATPAAPGRRMRFPRKRVLAWALALVALVVIFFATPAFGLLKNWIGRKDVFFKSGKTAPFVVKREFAEMSYGSPSAWNPQAIASESRQVTIFQVFEKKFPLYVAPTRKGGFCWTISDFGGSCVPPHPPAEMYALHGAVNMQLFDVAIGGYKDDWEVLGELHFHKGEVNVLKGETEEARKQFEQARTCFLHVFKEGHNVYKVIDDLIAKLSGKPQ